MVREMSLQEVLQGVVSLVVEFTQCDSCLVYLLDGKDLVLCAVQHAAPVDHRQAADALERRSHRLGGRASGGGCWRSHARRTRTRASKVFGELPEDTYEAFLLRAADCAQTAWWA